MDASSPSGRFDVAVIGAGVVGCAVARSFAVRGWRVLVLEKAADILEGASKGNSALLHTGYDEPEGSEELRILRHGFALYRRLHARMNLPLVETGALVVAWSAEDAARLAGIRDLAHRNGTGDARLVAPDELLDREPHLARDARGAVLIPGEGIVDPWSAPLAYLTQAVRHGARLVTRAGLAAARPAGAGWRLSTPAGEFEARIVVNAAGLFGDEVERLRGADPGFTIRPRKGQFLVFDKPARRLANAILLKVPTERTKGVLVAPTIFGNLLLGPTAEDQEDRRRAPCDEAVLRAIRAEGERMIPALAGETVTACFAGLRPATEHRDYVLKVDPAGWITVGGIRSTGLSAALGLGEWAAGQGGRLLGDARPAPPDDALDWPEMPNLSASAPRPYQLPGRAPIACHCEWVTEREVAAALASEIPPGTLGGLKRRTRLMLGRCQGFGCAGAAARLAPHLAGGA
ncbi:NAD(P)/FAD-dependent oxidoreductase [Amaricoccus sp.]|uniref:NAD(P)/FAD-dependent oxidoreductase n=1 Tax=Amaricoccus sp. TaxID=1872485 RepID=UPI0025BF02B6|nr:NAD(P)/FAD-dependent oxidoreductase [Amaricoccus sp.]